MVVAPSSVLGLPSAEEVTEMSTAKTSPSSSLNASGRCSGAALRTIFFLPSMTFCSTCERGAGM